MSACAVESSPATLRPKPRSLFVSSARTVQSLPLLWVNHWLRCCNETSGAKLWSSPVADRRSSRDTPGRYTTGRPSGASTSTVPATTHRTQNAGPQPRSGSCVPRMSTRRRSRRRPMELSHCRALSGHSRATGGAKTFPSLLAAASRTATRRSRRVSLTPMLPVQHASPRP